MFLLIDNIVVIITMDLNTLIAECTTYDFKLMLEEKKPKSWLKSVSAFANGLGGSLFFGIDNDGIARGLDDVQHVCEAISSKIRDYMDPLPEVDLIPQMLYTSCNSKSMQGIIPHITTLAMVSVSPLFVLVTRAYQQQQNKWYD